MNSEVEAAYLLDSDMDYVDQKAGFETGPLVDLLSRSEDLVQKLDLENKQEFREYFRERVIAARENLKKVRAAKKTNFAQI